MGASCYPSIQVHRYFLTLVDHFTWHSWVFLLKCKSQASTHLKALVHLVATQFNAIVKKIWTDNGIFFLKDFYASQAIIHHTSCVETPQQNAIIERKHQHLLNVTCALLFQANLPKCFWSFVVLHAAFLINRIP